MCPLNPDGTFAAKQRRKYVLNEHGNRIRDGKYMFNAVHTTDWHAPETPALIELLFDHLDKRNQGASSNKGKIRNLKQFSETINFLKQQNIRTLDELEERVSAVRTEFHNLTDSSKIKSERMKELEQLIQYAETYKQFKPVFDETNHIYWKGRREKFAQEHDSDLRRFHMARRVLQEKLGDKKLSSRAWQNELDRLKLEYAELSVKYHPIREELLKLLQVQHSVDAILKDRGIEPTHLKERTR